MGDAYFEEERNDGHLVEQKHVRLVELVPAAQELLVVLVCNLKQITWKNIHFVNFDALF